MQDQKNKKAVLGLSALYHDSGVALVGHDGEILFAAHEERYTRIKHDKTPPVHAIKQAQIYAAQHAIKITDAFYYEDPDLKKDRQIFNLGYLWASGSLKFKELATKAASADEKKTLKTVVRQTLGSDVPLHFKTLHHMSHACSAFLPSPFKNALTVVLDGVGEWDSSSAYMCTGNSLKKIWSRQFPQGLGLFYSAFTQLCGFRVNSGEYKLMGLAPYGEPKYLATILDKILVPKPAPEFFDLDLTYFEFLKGERMISDKLLALFGLEGIPKEGETRKVHLDIAASAQQALEHICATLISNLMQQTGQKNLCLAGGVGLNCVNNSKIMALDTVENIFIQPAAGDAGCALGAALDGIKSWPSYSRQTMPVPYLGSEYNQDAVINALEKRGVKKYSVPANHKEFIDATAALLNDRLIGGWFWGRSEFGPRALGARSIIARPDGADMQSRVNLKVKFRESFRPFAPIVLEADAATHF
ncbi:MAG: hypothetical protein KUG56_04510, partial [Kordiimonadaceae bacterium]|nr:hypothetical protein [Kordiimonadaceae bacterium]